MAGTAVNWRGTELAVYEGQLWGQLAIPSASARLTLHTDWTPESVANPNAFHYGHTKDGVKARIKASYIDHYADESPSPLVSFVDKVDMGIAGALLAVTDMDVIKNLLAGVGTYATGSGYKQVTIGDFAIAYQSIACIFPLHSASSAYYGIFHCYSSFNKVGVEFDVARTKMGELPIDFMGYGITTRASTDTTGNYWKQIA